MLVTLHNSSRLTLFCTAQNPIAVRLPRIINVFQRANRLRKSASIQPRASPFKFRSQICQIIFFSHARTYLKESFRNSRDCYVEKWMHIQRGLHSGCTSKEVCTPAEVCIGTDKTSPRCSTRLGANPSLIPLRPTSPSWTSS